MSDASKSDHLSETTRPVDKPPPEATTKSDPEQEASPDARAAIRDVLGRLWSVLGSARNEALGIRSDLRDDLLDLVDHDELGSSRTRDMFGGGDSPVTVIPDNPLAARLVVRDVNERYRHSPATLAEFVRTSLAPGIRRLERDGLDREDVVDIVLPIVDTLIRWVDTRTVVEELLRYLEGQEDKGVGFWTTTVNVGHVVGRTGLRMKALRELAATAYHRALLGMAGEPGVGRLSDAGRTTVARASTNLASIVRELVPEPDAGSAVVTALERLARVQAAWAPDPPADRQQIAAVVGAVGLGRSDVEPADVLATLVVLGINVSAWPDLRAEEVTYLEATSGTVVALADPTVNQATRLYNASVTLIQSDHRKTAPGLQAALAVCATGLQWALWETDELGAALLEAEGLACTAMYMRLATEARDVNAVDSRSPVYDLARDLAGVLRHPDIRAAQDPEVLVELERIRTSANTLGLTAATDEPTAATLSASAWHAIESLVSEPALQMVAPESMFDRVLATSTVVVHVLTRLGCDPGEGLDDLVTDVARGRSDPWRTLTGLYEDYVEGGPYGTSPLVATGVTPRGEWRALTARLTQVVDSIGPLLQGLAEPW